MPVEVELNTPLADALNAAIQPKLVEVGWGTGGGDESALAEYIILMLVNGKTQDQIAAELSGDLLSLPPDDPGVHEFSRWLFEQIETFSQSANGQAASQDAGVPSEMDTDMGLNDTPELNAPTGPRSMRNGNQRGGRMMRNISKAMDRSGDSVLHRVRGNERINTHGRTPPSGPRGGGIGRGTRGQHNRANNIQHGLAAGMGNPAFGGMPGMPGQPGQMDVFALLEQQNQMMYQLSQQIMTQQQNGPHQRRGGKSLFNRVHDPNRNHHGRPRPDGSSQEGAQGEDVDMTGGKREPPNPDETVCKWNLNCTNSECKFAHQSPAAPPGVAVDVKDPCSFGAACKNRKCVARHPSPATRTAHQGEQDCKFFPNCQNPRCPFKHPSMPLCRNGANCTTPNCKFTHVQTKCKFNPCLNPKCMFVHEEGQQGGFKDKVWTAEGNQEHVSDRKFVEGEEPAELVKGEDDDAAMKQEEEDVA